MSVATQTRFYFDLALIDTRKRFFQCVQKVFTMYVIYGERRQMRKMSDETLHDIGINRDELHRECSRNITDIPMDRTI